MHKLKSVLVLLLWIGCFSHCFLEQLEAFDVQAANAEVCCRGDTDSEEEPCDPCGFAFLGGAITISQLLVGVPLSDFGSDIDKFLSIISPEPATDPDSPPPDTLAPKGCFRALCEELVLTGLPVRGPTAV